MKIKRIDRLHNYQQDKALLLSNIVPKRVKAGTLLGVSFCSLLFLSFSVIACSTVLAAVGCDLNDPDRDVARLFPGSTGYKTHYLAIDQKGGPSLLAQIEERLGDRFQGLYETIDVPYTLYEVFKDKERANTAVSRSFWCLIRMA